MKTNRKQSIIALFLASFLAMPFVFAANEPANVSNVSAVSKDATTLTVSWDAAKDYQNAPVANYRIYYGTKSVQKGDAASYDVQVDTPNNNTTYDLGSLTTNTPYYVSVTAIDAAKVESAEYSIEVSGTPKGSAPAANVPPAVTTPPAAPAVGGDKVAPTVVNALAMDKNHVLVGFSEVVKLPELLAEAAFTITDQTNPAKILEVKSAKKYDKDTENKTIVLETADQTKNTNYVVTASVAITDMAGNPIQSGSTDSGLFLGSDVMPVVAGTTPAVTTPAPVAEVPAAVVAPDTTAPEDVTNFVLSFKKDLEKFVVSMSWTASLNSAKDLVDQILYSSQDRGVTYDTGSSLGASATTHDVPNLEGGKEYTFKLATKDAKGNESVGVVKSIRLPQTGIGAGMLVVLSAAVANTVLRRKKKQEVL